MVVYKGSCHCKKIVFEFNTKNIFDDIYTCNCSLCLKKSIFMKADDKKNFKILSGNSYISCYKWNKRIAEHYFCKHCGVYTHHKRRREPNQISVNLRCVDGILIPSELVINEVDGASHS